MKEDENYGRLKVGYTGAQCSDPCIGKGKIKDIGGDSNIGYCMACLPKNGSHKENGIYSKCTRCYPGFVLVPKSPNDNFGQCRRIHIGASCQSHCHPAFAERQFRRRRASKSVNGSEWQAESICMKACMERVPVNMKDLVQLPTAPAVANQSKAEFMKALADSFHNLNDNSMNPPKPISSSCEKEKDKRKHGLNCMGWEGPKYKQGGNFISATCELQKKIKCFVRGKGSSSMKCFVEKSARCNRLDLIYQPDYGCVCGRFGQNLVHQHGWWVSTRNPGAKLGCLNAKLPDGKVQGIVNGAPVNPITKTGATQTKIHRCPQQGSSLCPYRLDLS